MPKKATNKILYFAYGSNMLTCRLRDRTPSATKMGVGFVEEYRLTFDKVSIDFSGKCDMNPTGVVTDRVYGVLFKIDPSEKTKLDDAEGLGKGYKEECVEVVRGKANRKIKAVAYIATSKNPILKPYHWYKALVVAGAVEHRLPNPYIEWLRKVQSRPDPDAKRCEENEAVLFNS